MRITELEFESYGVDHEQYFRGASTAFTMWDECYVGIGNTEREAAEDAIEEAAMAGHEYDWDSLRMKEFDDTVEVPEALGLESWDECEEAHFYMALFARFEKDDNFERAVGPRHSE